MLHVRNIARPTLALDRADRSFDIDGRLRVSICNISKANVCGYEATEIPDWRSLGLQPGRVYQLLRPPEELARAVSSFNNLPLLSRHQPVDVTDHAPDLVCGCTGSDARFTAPYLTNSLIVWTAAAISGIETEARKELSGAYRYRALMVGGTFEGARYDGRMTEIVGNHIALVESGRAGSDVALDAAPRSRLQSFEDRFPHAGRIRISA